MINGLSRWTESIRRIWFDFEDGLFEWRHGLDLSAQVPHHQLVADDAECLSHATAYHAVWCRNLRVLLQQARLTGSGFENFVDIGAGKGKACFYASRRMQFSRVVGVEFSAPLVETAKRNAMRFGKAHITFEQADAACYRLPDSPCIVFMFNPFDEVIMRRFLTHNAAHFGRWGSVVAYANDMQRAVLEEQGFEATYRDPLRKISLYVPRLAGL